MDDLRETLRAEITRLRQENARLVAALKFYADGEHLYGSLGEDWDECGDREYAGWLWPCEAEGAVEDEAWGVENGLRARAAIDRAIGEQRETEYMKSLFDESAKMIQSDIDAAIGDGTGV